MCDILFVRSRKARPSSVPPKLDFGGDSQHCCPPSQNFGGESPSLSPHDLHHWGIYVLCYCTKLENLTLYVCTIHANFYHLQGLWLEGCLKMHFLQVECKSSSRSGVDPDLQLRGGEMGSRGKAPGQGSGGMKSP